MFSPLRQRFRWRWLRPIPAEERSRFYASVVILRRRLPLCNRFGVVRRIDPIA
jgi:hypothetical protein